MLAKDLAEDLAGVTAIRATKKRCVYFSDYWAGDCGGLEGGAWAVFGASGAKAKIF
jgi:beta-phosphoglucomutase-like phosphatase (HAD superfamily)